MRRTLMICVLLLAGCAKSQPPVADTAATDAAMAATISLSDLAGVWTGTIMAAGSDAVLVNMELTATEDPAGWSMTVTNANDPMMTTTITGMNVVASGDSVTFDAGPFQSVLRAGQQVTTHNTHRLQDGQLVGTAIATYPASGETSMLNSVATRKTN